MKPNERKDLLTGETFVPQRINQRFVCPENRIIYYNDKANKIRHHLSVINKPLLAQWRILTELLSGKPEAVFNKQFLLGKGISFELFTNYDKYDGKTVNAIYEYIIIKLNDEQIKIIKND